MLRPHDQTSIAALSSGSGPGAVALIRVSGADAWDIVAKCLITKVAPQHRQMQKRNIVDPANGSVVDDVMLTFFQGPHSFTGQDTVELYTHGGPYIVQKVLAILYQSGARPAEPGEFTKRALLNGKLDLTMAEGIRDLIESQSHQQWLSGRQLYTGKLQNVILELRTQLVEAMAYLEAMIDFPDEGDTQHVDLTQIKTRVEKVFAKIESLVGTFESGHVASHGLRVALVGAPNAGKSTLLNMLLGKDRAIVSPVPGTTRDYLEEPCLIEGRLVRLVDMAGIRDTADAIERQGVMLSTRIAREADLVVGLMASDAPTDERKVIQELIESIEKPRLAVLTKSDLGVPRWAEDYLPLSCYSGDGVQDLKKKLAKAVDDHVNTLSNDPFITSLRHRNALRAALANLERFRASWTTASRSHELLAFELQAAARELGAVIGEISSEDILDKVFSEFCIGK